VSQRLTASLDISRGSAARSTVSQRLTASLDISRGSAARSAVSQRLTASLDISRGSAARSAVSLRLTATAHNTFSGGYAAHRLQRSRMFVATAATAPCPSGAVCFVVA
jgi:hypothetical protein